MTQSDIWRSVWQITPKKFVIAIIGVLLVLLFMAFSDTILTPNSYTSFDSDLRRYSPDPLCYP